MRRRYYRDDDAVIADFVAWAMITTGMGLVELVKILSRPGAYTPFSPDEPRQVSGILERVPKIDWTQAVLPKVNVGSLKRFGNVRSIKDLKEAAQNLSGDLKTVQFSWSPDERPQLIPRSELAHPFSFPQVVGEPRAYRIAPPQVDANPDASVQLVRDLLSSVPRITLEIVGNGSETVWQITDYEGRYPPEIILSHIRTHSPGAVVDVIDPTVIPERAYPFFRQLLVFGLTNEYAAPMPFFPDMKGSDPLMTLTRRMDFLDPSLEERVQYQVFSLAYSAEAGNRAGKRLLHGTVKPTSGIIEDKTDPLAGFDLKLLNAKLDHPLYHIFVAVTVESRDENRLDEVAQVAHDVMRVRQPRYNGLTLVGSPKLKHQIDGEEQANIVWFETLLTAMVKSYQPDWRRLLSVLSPPEIATLWHLPDETFTGEKIAWAAPGVPKELLVETDAPGERLTIGAVKRAGKAATVSIANADRAAHQAIFGKTQTGKSTLMHTLIHQDIAAGRGVSVIDPHGKLIDDILTRSIPAERHQDIVLLDCGRDDYPVPLNPFRIPEGVKFASAFNYLYWITRKIYADIWLSGETDMVMRNVIQALLCDPEATPLDIRRLFANDGYRKRVVDRMRAHEYVSLDTLAYWNDFDARSQGDRRETASPVFNRTRAFVGNRTLEMMTCHPKGLDFQTLIRERKIVLVNLRGEEIAAEAGNLGALFLGGFYLASEALDYVPDNAPPRYHLYIDEVERFITSPLPDMFSQSRKFGLSLTMANQYVEQLSKETYQAVMGTVGTHFLFELGIDDAGKLSKLVEPDVEQEALTRLGLYRMAVKTRAEGNSLPSFVIATHPMPESVGAPYARQTDIPDMMNGKDVRAWIAKRIAETDQPPDSQPPKPSGDRKVTDYE